MRQPAEDPTTSHILISLSDGGEKKEVRETEVCSEACNQYSYSPAYLKILFFFLNTVAVKTIDQLTGMNPKVNEGPMRDMQRGDGTRKCVQEKRVRESINHSYAPVRVVSGTKRKHMQLYNISRPPASRTGSLKPSPLHHLAVP